MSYVSQTLASDEAITLRARFNWTYSFWHVFFFILGFAPLAVFIWGQTTTGQSFSELAIGYYVSGFSALIGCLILLSHLVELWTTEIVVTTYRFIYKTGLVSRDTKEVSLNNIEEVNLHQSVWGRIFGYGKIILRGTGVGVIELPNIDNPIDVRRTIEDARSQRRQNERRSMSNQQAEPTAAALAATASGVETQALQSEPTDEEQAALRERQRSAGVFDVLKEAVTKDKAAKRGQK